MTTAHDAPHDELEGPYRTATRVGLGIVVLLMVAMWIWIYGWAPRSNPDRLETRSFAAAAEALCTPFAAQIDALPRTTTETTVVQRADLVEEGTRLTAAMVDALKVAAAEVTDEDDRRLLELWFEDWDAYISDRDAYATRLRTASPDTARSDLAFTLSERSSGGIYTRTIDGFASVNDMTSCAVPADI